MKLTIIILLSVLSGIHCGLLKGLAGSLTGGKDNPLTDVAEKLDNDAQKIGDDLGNALGLGKKEKPTPSKTDDKKEPPKDPSATADKNTAKSEEKMNSTAIENDKKDADEKETTESAKKTEEATTPKAEVAEPAKPKEKRSLRRQPIEIVAPMHTFEGNEESTNLIEDDLSVDSPHDIDFESVW